MREFSLECRAVEMLRDPRLQPVQRGHESLGHITAAEGAVAAFRVRINAFLRGLRARRRAHASPSKRAAAARATRTNW